MQTGLQENLNLEEVKASKDVGKKEPKKSYTPTESKTELEPKEDLPDLEKAYNGPESKESPEKQKKRELEKEMADIFAPLQKMIDTGRVGDFGNWNNFYGMLVFAGDSVEDDAIVNLDEGLEISLEQYSSILENGINSRNSLKQTTDEYIDLLKKLKKMMKIDKVEVNGNGKITKIYLERPES